MKIDVRYCDDWEALYVDGDLYEEGHSLNWHAILQQLLPQAGISFTSVELDLPEDFNDDTHYVHFADQLDSIVVGRYPDEY